MRFFRAVHWLLVFVILSVSASAFAQVSISVNFGPPPLPVYEQPLCPGDGFIWVPGYWAWGGPYGYYWVPGTWVLAPEPGFLWTPAWWGWDGGAFLFHEGYWGPRVGFYGGIYYGFGYFGHGYEGGRWEGDRFFYNRSVNNINVTNIHNVYNTTIINNNTTVINRVSYNGGQGGLTARPTQEEEAAGRERRVGPTANQTRHVELARDNPELRASSNHGKPPIAATPRPTEFQGREVVPAREAGGPYKGGGNNVPRPPVPAHAKDLQPPPHMDAPNTGNPKLDTKYQKQQDKLYAQQEKDHQKMAQQQEKEHEKLAKQNAQEAQRQQVEQRHQQQTMQMEQQHEQQRQNLQMHQQPQNHGGPPPQHH
jgi:hypothetical protein